MPIIYEEIQETVKIITGFKCNKCHYHFDNEDYNEMQEMFFWSTTGGYGSEWGDGRAVEIVLCQTCAFEVLGDYAEDKVAKNNTLQP